jgi:polyisoprenoid-binding protein YceI
VRGDVSIDRTDFGVGEPKSWNPMSITNEIKINFEATLSD